MNCQELVHIVNKNIKLIVLDNQGYGIIRQTQEDFYESNYLGSSFKSAAPLPRFSVKPILEGFLLNCRVVDHIEALNGEISKFFLDPNIRALVINVPFGERIQVDLYD